MPYDLSNVLVIGISSRALFDLEYENGIFDNEGLVPFLEYQRHHESDVLKPGTGFHLVQSLLKLNSAADLRRVEVMIMSRNHPDVYLRVSNSIQHHGLDITRAMLTGGERLDRYLKAYKIDLFLSASDEDVTSALRHGIAAGRIYRPPTAQAPPSGQIRIAFDGDCVLFNEEADLIGRTNLRAFHQHEQDNASIPLPDGPFAKLIRTVAQMQGPDPEKSPFLIGLVTARNAPSHERAIRTLRAWNVRIDSGAFLGGLPKDPWLVAFQPQIFFDDQESYCRAASAVVPTARVPFPFTEELAEVTIQIGATKAGDGRQGKFLLICKGYLKQDAGHGGLDLEGWYTKNLADCAGEIADAFLNELDASIKGSPAGKERPAKGQGNARKDKFVAFLDALLQKHRAPRPTHG